MATTKLTYSSSPETSYPNKKIKLTINARNETAEAIQVSKDDEITITIPDGLLTNLANLQATTPANSGYFVKDGDSPGEFIVKANPFSSEGQTIKPNVAWTINFENASISGKTDSYSIGISETLGGATEKNSIAFSIQAEKKEVLAWLNPRFIGDQEMSTLYWQVPKGTTQITISGYPNKQDVPVPNVTVDGNIQVYMLPGPTETQRTFKVRALLGKELKISAGQVLQKNAPIISSFVATQISKIDREEGPPPVTEIDFNESVNLNWLTDYATSVLLSSPLVPGKLVAHNDLKVTVSPGSEILNLYFGLMDQLPASADYYLTVNGMEEPKSKNIKLTFKQVELVYFKYTSDAKTNVKFETNPPNWTGAQQEFINGKWQLRFYQFGGKVSIHFPDGVLES